MQITINIEDGFYDGDFKVGFLKENPIPVDPKGNPSMSEDEWIQQWGIDQYNDAYARGKTVLAQEQIQPIIQKGGIGK